MPTIVLIGANSDIAQSMLQSLQTNKKCVLVTRDIQSLPAESQEKYDCYNCDPCDMNALNDCIATIQQKDSITDVIHFCGSILLKPAALITQKEWDQTIDINLNSAFYTAHAVTKNIKKDCQLIFFSSAAAQLGLPNHEAIAAAKAGVEGLSKSIAASYAGNNIRSNVIAPGLIESKLSKHITGSEKGRALSLSLHASNRLGQPKDVASLIDWLVDDNNQWITGSVFNVDGGLCTTKCYR